MKSHVYSIFSPALLILIVSLACGGTGTPAIPTSTATLEPPTLEPTKTIRPTSTPRPTATAMPPTATPAQVGDKVTNDLYDLEVLYVRKLNTVYLDDVYHWEPNPGYLFLELGVKVTNLQNGETAGVPWEYIYVIEEDGNSWYPYWANYKASNTGVVVNPKELIFKEVTLPGEEVTFDQDVYLRLIWIIKDNNPSTVWFGFDTSPLTEVVID